MEIPKGNEAMQPDSDAFISGLNAVDRMLFSVVEKSEQLLEPLFEAQKIQAGVMLKRLAGSLVYFGGNRDLSKDLEDDAAGRLTGFMKVIDDKIDTIESPAAVGVVTNLLAVIFHGKMAESCWSPATEEMTIAQKFVVDEILRVDGLFERIKYKIATAADEKYYKAIYEQLRTYVTLTTYEMFHTIPGFIEELSAMALDVKIQKHLKDFSESGVFGYSDDKIIKFELRSDGTLVPVFTSKGSDFVKQMVLKRVKNADGDCEFCCCGSVTNAFVEQVAKHANALLDEVVVRRGRKGLLLDTNNVPAINTLKGRNLADAETREVVGLLKNAIENYTLGKAPRIYVEGYDIKDPFYEALSVAVERVKAGEFDGVYDDNPENAKLILDGVYRAIPEMLRELVNENGLLANIPKLYAAKLVEQLISLGSYEEHSALPLVKDRKPKRVVRFR